MRDAVKSSQSGRKTGIESTYRDWRVMKHVLVIVAAAILDMLGLALGAWLLRRPGDWTALGALMIMTVLGIFSAYVFHLKIKALLAGDVD